MVLIVLALGRIEAWFTGAAGLALATLFFRARLCAAAGAPLALSLRLRGRADGVVDWCSFCWWRRSRSRLAKHRLQSPHSKGFSLVCERSCLFKCSRRANARWQVVQTWGRGLSVFGGGKLAVGVLVLTVIVEASALGLVVSGELKACTEAQ